MNIIPINKDTSGSSSLIGGKGRGLIHLISAGVRVPETACIPPEADISESVKEIHEYFSDISQSRLYAVRSSAWVEDGVKKSYAGQFESYLRVAGNNLSETIAKCRESGKSDRIKAYHGGETAEISVLVQEMIEADFAGVLFTCDPVSGSRNHIVMEVVRGTGENLVGGTVTPHRYLFDLKGNLIDDSVETVTGKELLRRLVKEALQIENRLQEAGIDGPLDFEWAVKSGEIFWLQVRPVTAMGIPSKENELIFFLKPGEKPRVEEGETHWTSQNAREAMPGVINPLSVHVIKESLKTGFGEIIAIAGVSQETLDNMEILEFFNGRAFLSVTGMTRIFSHTPIKNSSEMVNHILSGESAALHQLDLSFKKLWIILRFAVRDMKVISSFHSTVESVLKKWRYPSDEELKAKTLQELANKTIELVSFGSLFTRHIIGTGHYMGAYSMMDKICRKYGANPSEMIQGLGSLKFAASSRYLRDLAYNIHSKSSLLFDENFTLKEDWKKILETHTQLIEFNKLFRWFLDKYGHIGSGSINLYEKNWRETPEKVLILVGDILRTGNVVDGAEYLRMLSLRREKAIKDLRSKLSIKDRLFFPIILHLMQNAAPFRENVKFTIHKLMAVAKEYINEIGKRFVSRGILTEYNDIYFLYRDEVEKIIETGDNTSLFHLVEKRRGEYDYRLSLPCPLHRVESTNGIRLYYPAPAGGGTRFSGTPASSGVVSAKARVILDLTESSRLQPGEILVTLTTDPSWTALFTIAGGVVVEIGSMLSHGAVVARESGIPAVMGIPGIVATVRNGDILHIDGSKGEVIIEKNSNIVQGIFNEQ